MLVCAQNAPGQPTKCLLQPALRKAQVGCLSPYGGQMDMYWNQLLVGSSQPHRILELNDTGQAVRKINSGLGGDPHVAEFAVDAQRNRLYQLGSCSYTGGMSLVNLRSGSSRLLEPRSVPGPFGTASSNHSVCGESLAVGVRSLVIVGKSIFVTPMKAVPGEVLLIDGLTGRVRARVKTAASPVDVLGVR